MAGAEKLRYEKGDRVWARGTLREPLPGVVIGHHVDWNLYRVSTWSASLGRARGPWRSGASPPAGVGESAESSEHPAARRDVEVRGEKHHLPGLVRHP